jgi:uncharacterized protein (TIGR00730 family)
VTVSEPTRDAAVVDVRGASAAFLDTVGARPGDRRLLGELLATVAGLAADHTDELDLKIAASALAEMRSAYRIFAPWDAVPKVTVFGSARTRPDDPLYLQARAVAAELATHGWMVVTGAGPGIMAAAMEGAGRERSIGVNIRLPFEQGANPIIAGDAKLVSMKYFFTRKLMLMKESKAFVCLAGGFGTLDETFELLTLTQTGKGQPVPIVFLETPGDHYWRTVVDLMRDELVVRGLVMPADLDLFTVVDSPAAAVAEIQRFYRVYDSMRFVGDWLVLRLRRELTETDLAALSERFGVLLVTGAIERTAPMREEVGDDDLLHMPRVRLRFDRRHWAELHRLILAIDDLEA